MNRLGPLAQRLLGQHAGMVFVADDLSAWLVGVLADASRKKLTTFILGDDQERALRLAVTVAVQRTADDLQAGNEERAEQLAMVISEVFRTPAPALPLDEDATVLEALQTGIAGQLAVLDDASLTGIGQSSADVLGVSSAVVTAKLIGHLVREIMVRGSRTGPLEPLANQLNHDKSYLQGLRVEGKVDRLDDMLLEILARLDRADAVAAAPTALAQLPPVTTGFTGRNDELVVLARLLDPANTAGQVRVSAVVGLAGVGKTTLAVQAGHAAQQRGWFRGGVLFLDLHGYDDKPVEPSQALDALLRALRVPAKGIPPTAEERAGLYRSILARITKPVLLIADNASTEAQVRLLLPGAGPHKVVLTSRHTLAELDARLIDVAALDEQAGVELLDRALRAARPGDDRITSHLGRTGQLARLCGGLPLALQITAALLKADPTLRVAELADELAIESQRLEALKYDPAGLSVVAAFELSYRRLEQIPAKMFRLLPVNPGPDVSTAAAAVLMDMPEAKARKILGVLAQAHMIEAAPGMEGRWRMHDLVRLYARQKSADCAAEDGRERTLDLLLAYYLGITVNADNRLKSLPGKPETQLFTTRSEALDWLDAERRNLAAVTTVSGSRTRDKIALMMCINLGEYLSWRRRWDDLLTMSTVSLELARRSSDLAREGIALINQGSSLYHMRRLNEALTVLHDAVTIFRGIGDRSRLAGALSNLGVVQREANQFGQSINTLYQALATYREVGEEHGEAEALGNLGRVLARGGQTGAAIAVFYDAVAIFRRIDDRYGEGKVLDNLGGVLGEAGYFSEAIAVLRTAESILRESGDLYSHGAALNDLGGALIEANEFDHAISVLSEAIAIFRKTGDRRAEGIALDNLKLAQAAQQAQG